MKRTYRCILCRADVMPNYDHVGAVCAPGACTGTFAHGAGTCPLAARDICHYQVLAANP